MDGLRIRIVALLAGRDFKPGAGAVRGRARRTPACERLEGRQLLNARMAGDLTGGPGGPMGMLGGPIGGVPGQFHTMDQAGHAAGSAPKVTLSAQAQADMKTLRADEQAFRNEIPASLTATIQADQAVIRQAMASLPKPTFGGRQAGPPRLDKLVSADPATARPSTFDPTAGLKAMLTKANVSSSEIETIVRDFQNARTTLGGVDPTLQSKIAADQAALQKDMPAPHFDHAPGGGGGGAWRKGSATSTTA
jgi:hypothetical protein